MPATQTPATAPANVPSTAQAQQLSLTLSYEVTSVPLPDGGLKLMRGKLQIKGGTKQAARVLACSQQTIVRMIAEGTIPARKLRGNKRNSKFIVDMTAVYELAKVAMKAQ